MERIERLERANRIWRVVSFLSVVGILVLGGYVYSQRDLQKGLGAQPAAANFAVDPAPAPVSYTNFARVSVTPDEVILDLALQTDMDPEPKQPIRVSNRVVMNYFTAKRFSNALQQVVQQHEATYGLVELDFQKRMLPGAKPPGGK
jgi:hypothetical protein